MHIQRGSEVPWQGVTHNPEIRKRVFVGNGVVPKLTNFSQSVFTPGQRCEPHAHRDMFEVYLVEGGCGVLVIDGVEVELSEGDSAVVEPGENHSMQNRSENEDLRLIYFGIEL